MLFPIKKFKTIVEFDVNSGRWIRSFYLALMKVFKWDRMQDFDRVR